MSCIPVVRVVVDTILYKSQAIVSVIGVQLPKQLPVIQLSAVAVNYLSATNSLLTYLDISQLLLFHC